MKHDEFFQALKSPGLGGAMLYVRSLATEEYQELREMKRREIGRVSQRAHMVLLSAKQWAVPRIAALFEVSPATVRAWIRKFEAEGPKGLYDDGRSGRPRTAAEAAGQAEITRRRFEQFED